MPPRTILALGIFHPERRKRLEAFAKETSFELMIREDIDAALKWLEAHDPRVVLFDTMAPKAHALCLKVRSKKSLTSVPIIGLARVISDAAMSKLFAAGADDVVPIFARDPLLHRLKAIPADQSIHPPPDRGKALVADSDHDRCSVIGRTLMHAGYDVKFAIDRRALDHYARDPSTKVVVASAELGTPQSMIEEARKAGGTEAVWILTDVERDASLGAETLAGFPNAIRVSAFMPPESLLFLSNELLSPQMASKRMSPRILHGTVVEFREAGGEEDDLGFTYNASLGGVFIRTLAAPACQHVWLDLRAPGTSRRVRLEGEVMWRRPFSPGKFAITPPGFGVHIKAGLGDDLQRWHEALEKLVAASKKPPRLDELLEETLRDSMVTAVEPPPLPLRPLAGSPKPPGVLPSAGPPPLPGSPKPPGVSPSAGPPPLPAAPAAPAAKRTMLGLGPVASLIAADTPKPSKSTPPPLPPPLPSPPAMEPVELGAPAPSPTHRATPPAPAVAPLVPEAASSPQPAVAPAAPSQAAPRRTGRIVAMLAGGGLLIAAAAAAVIFLTRSSKPAPLPAPATNASTAGPGAAQPSAAVSPTAPSAERSAAPASAPASASASATASSAAASASVSAVASDTGPDGTDLLTTEGYLVVTFPSEGDVYATGIKVGKTNQKNKSRCGQKFVRVGSGDPPTWISEGMTVKVVCQSVTKVTATSK